MAKQPKVTEAVKYVSNHKFLSMWLKKPGEHYNSLVQHTITTSPGLKVRFQFGELITDDPEIIRLMDSHPHYGKTFKRANDDLSPEKRVEGKGIGQERLVFPELTTDLNTKLPQGFAEPPPPPQHTDPVNAIVDLVAKKLGLDNESLKRALDTPEPAMVEPVRERDLLGPRREVEEFKPKPKKKTKPKRPKKKTISIEKTEAQKKYAKKFPCPYCEAVFPSGFQLGKHKKEAHPDV